MPLFLAHPHDETNYSHSEIQDKGPEDAHRLFHALSLPATGQDPVHPIIRHMNLVLQSASRCVGVRQAQVQIVEELRRLQAKVVKITGAIDGRNVHQ